MEDTRVEGNGIEGFHGFTAVPVSPTSFTAWRPEVPPAAAPSTATYTFPEASTAVAKGWALNAALNAGSIAPSLAAIFPRYARFPPPIWVKLPPTSTLDPTSTRLETSP